MATITTLSLPIAWDAFGWAVEPRLGAVSLRTGDPAWAWEPAAPALAVPACEPAAGAPVEDFVVDHVVLLVPALDAAIATLGRVGIEPRLRMAVSGRPAAFFRVGPVLEVIESPVRAASLYGVALATSGSLESVAIAWRGRGLEVGDVKPAIQPGRRIMTVHGLDAGLAVMSADGATHPR